MSDIVSRLLLDTKDYDSKLGKAKQSSNNFASDIGGKAAAAVGKFAAGLGVAMGAAEAFDRIINSSQTTGDKYAQTMEGLKASVDTFFTSISTGDFTSFITGMDAVVTKAREAYAAMDQLGNAQMSFGIAQIINQRDIAEAQQLAKNKFAPLDVRKEAFGKWATAIGTQQAQSAQLEADIQEYVTKAVESKAGIKGFTANMDNVMKGLLLDIQDKGKREELKKKYEEEYKEYTAAVSEASKLLRTGSKTEAERMQDSRKYYETLANLNEKYNEAITINSLLVKYGDDDLKAIGDHVKGMIQLDGAVANLKREYNETANEFNNANKGVKGFTPLKAFEGYTVYSGPSEAPKNFTQGVSKNVVEAAEGSLAALEVEIKKAQQEYANTASEAARQAAWETIQELQAAKAAIEFNARNPNGPKGSLSVGRSSLASLASMPDMGKIQPIPINKEAVKNVNDYVNGINAMSNVISALNTNTIDGAAGFLTWAANLATATAMAVDSAKALIPAKTAEGAASAGAEAAKTPLVGWLLVGGAIASAIAAFASIPNFAEGGVVPGSNFRDGIAARLSSGEMVINPADQKKLFDSIHSGNLGGGGSARSVITGEQIVTVVNNYGRRTGRGAILKG
jgi:hypothetical protein